MPDILLPPQKPGEPNVEWKDVRSVVVIGANGSGKSRFGVWVEQKAIANAHRVGAQRALSIPQVIQPRPYEQARSYLLYGAYEKSWNPQQHVNQKFGQRWQSEPATVLLNDFEFVLSMLFAEESKRNRDYTRKAMEAAPDQPAPKCNLDRLADIWRAVLPHRLLKIGDDKLEASTTDGSVYEGRHMSDGERVAIYLMGQVLSAPQGSIVIVDEPEIHIHNSIQAALWDELEAVRSDCAFVYITHDLDFASTRRSARKIWVKKFDGKQWEWEEVPSAPGLPDALLFEVLGSRRPILFVEGDESSYDTMLYTSLYPSELVLPRQSCGKVIEATKALGGLASPLHLSVRGIVDRDRRGDEEIRALRGAGVLVADVAEVENLLCLPEALRAVASALKIADVAGACGRAKERVLGTLRSDLEAQSLSRALAEVQFKLNGFGPKIGRMDAVQLEREMQQYLATIDLQGAVTKAKELLEKVLSEGDYLAALRLYNSKGIPTLVAQTFGISKDTYIQMVVGLVRDDSSGPIANAMRSAIT